MPRRQELPVRIGVVGTGRIGAFHARTLLGLPGVREVVVSDADAERAAALARNLGIRAAADVAELYELGVDGVVVTAATSAHAGLIHQALDHETPVFCEKPVALDVPATVQVVRRAEAATVPVQIGFQRRFDRGYRAARDALRNGDLGWLHTLRAVTADATPPPPAFLATSGGLFRDCGIHDFDAIRWLTGQEVASVFAYGANRGEHFFTEAGDVDSYVSVLRLHDDTLATVTSTRYNGAGHDVRMEVCGSLGARFVGLDNRAAMPTAEHGLSWGRATPYQNFMERFAGAFVAELETFVEVAAGRAGNPCPPAEALEALYVAEACDLSRRTGQPVDVATVRA